MKYLIVLLFLIGCKKEEPTKLQVALNELKFSISKVNYALFTLECAMRPFRQNSCIYKNGPDLCDTVEVIYND